MSKLARACTWCTFFACQTFTREVGVHGVRSGAHREAGVGKLLFGARRAVWLARHGLARVRGVRLERTTFSQRVAACFWHRGFASKLCFRDVVMVAALWFCIGGIEFWPLFSLNPDPLSNVKCN